VVELLTVDVHQRHAHTAASEPLGGRVHRESLVCVGGWQVQPHPVVRVDRREPRALHGERDLAGARAVRGGAGQGQRGLAKLGPGRHGHTFACRYDTAFDAALYAGAWHIRRIA
jgi:hypothetical protein